MDEYLAHTDNYYMKQAGSFPSGLPKLAPPIKKAEQTKPDTRATRRQAKREQDRKWEIKYAEEGIEKITD